MKKITILVCSLVAGSFLLNACGKTTNPVAPKNQIETEKSVKTGLYKLEGFRPAGITYEGRFWGAPGAKPWYWNDATSLMMEDLGATIVTRENGQSSDITVVPTQQNPNRNWGHVQTFPINYTSGSMTIPSIRILVPSHTSSMSWKLNIVGCATGSVTQHSWVVQGSTGVTGYVDYNCSTIMSEFLAYGHTQFYIDLVAEGAPGQSFEVAELYFFDKNGWVSPADAYWTEMFTPAQPVTGNRHTAGWFDQTNSPGFNCVIENQPNNVGCIVGNPTQWGKVQSAVLPWNSNRCNTLWIGITDPNAAFSVYIQEQSGAYRQWQISKSFEGDKFVCNLMGQTQLTDGTPFSVVIADVYGTIYITNAIQLF